MPTTYYKSVILALIFVAPQGHALFCNEEDREWCVEPRCACEDVFPSFLGRSSGSVLQTAKCKDGFSGGTCKCGYSKTNIADDSSWCWPFPDTLKGALTVTTTASATGSILVGTWRGGWEAPIQNPYNFTSVFDKRKTVADTLEENTWSIAKTANGNILVGQDYQEGIRIKRPGETEFTVVLEPGTLGGFVVSGNEVYAATWEGLYYSSDGGESWTRAPTDCYPYNWPVNGSEPNPLYPPKPAANETYCDDTCTAVTKLDDGSILAFYSGWAGVHQIQPGDDPLLKESWTNFTAYQDSEACQSKELSLICHPIASAVFGDYLYVVMLASPMARMNLTSQVWERVDIGTDRYTGQLLNPTALAVVPDGSRLFVATDDGLFSTSDGETWDHIDDDECPRRFLCSEGKNPFAGRGMVATKDVNGTTTIVWGTVEGPWIYKY